MEKPYNIHIEITENEDTNEILKMYWEVNEEIKFVHPVANITQKFGTYQNAVSNLAKLHTKFELLCQECGNPIISTSIRSEVNNLENHLLDNKYICRSCRIEIVKTKLPDTYEPVYAAMKAAIDTQAWKKLDSEILEILIRIAQCSSKQQIYDWHLQGDSHKSYRGRVFWQKMRILEDLKLVWVKRDEKYRVLDFIIEGELVEILRVEYSDKFQPEDKEIEIPKDTLKITLQPTFSPNRTSPAFQGIVMLQSKIELPKGTPLFYQATVNDDGTLTLNIMPRYEDPFRTAIENDFKQPQPMPDFLDTEIPW